MNLGDGTYQGLCPDGWHLPTAAEWQALVNHANGLAGFASPSGIFNEYTYAKLSDPFRSTESWVSRPGTNELGFDVKAYEESQIGYGASFWTSQEVNVSNVTIVKFGSTSITLGSSDWKQYRHSIRCVAGAATSSFPQVQFSPAAKATGTFTDARDGKSYYFVQIGTQKWMAENLAYLPTSGFSACYAMQEDHCRIFGRFYDFATAPTVCPAGWHLPTAAEWTTLVQTIDAATANAGPQETGTTYTIWALGDQFKSMPLWSPPPATEPPFGFQALPAGFTSKGSGSGTLGEDANFWVADATTNRVFEVAGSTATIKEVAGGYEFSVRCLAD
jgi:uncharacterized protein (TIGR02145 family)